jgi:glutamate formiminotransferase / formiminotetrahydrofolate cyclodeaminase
MNVDHILECVPNFSEGRDQEKIDLIAREIQKVNGVKLLHVDIGKDAHRTVMTFAGIPEAVVEAAFLAVKKASELIDMRLHKGIHPRFGATDVLPLIPVAGITMEETITLARKLGQRIGTEIGSHVYCYEFAAFEEKRRNLANCRAGEYEGLPDKIKKPEWLPDFGPAQFNATTGATAVGARNFLIAYNITLDTTDVNIAKTIAAEIREIGKKVTITGTNGDKHTIHQPGLFKGLKAIGWPLPQYHKTQVSTNITDITRVPVHILFEKVKEIAGHYSTQVTGSELVGLIPKTIMLDAGKYYGQPHALSSDEEYIGLAVKKLGLADLAPFHITERILEFALASPSGSPDNCSITNHISKQF